jgi:hypothetical protein
VTPRDIVRGAIPDADDETIEYVIWGRTPFPFRVDPREIYKAAAGYRRACKRGLTLCDFCSRPVDGEQWACERCEHAFASGNGRRLMLRRPNRHLSGPVLAHVRGHPGATVTSISKALRVDTMAVGNALASLYRRGRICKAGMEKSAHKWFAVDDDGFKADSVMEDK